MILLAIDPYAVPALLIGALVTFAILRAFRIF